MNLIFSFGEIVLLRSMFEGSGGIRLVSSTCGQEEDSGGEAGVYQGSINYPNLQAF